MAIRWRNLLIPTPETSPAARATTFDIPFRPASKAMTASQALSNVLRPDEMTTTSAPQLSKTSSHEAIPGKSLAPGTDAALRPHEIATRDLHREFLKR